MSQLSRVISDVTSVQYHSSRSMCCMATAEHREPCKSRGSCTVLGAPGGETPLGSGIPPSSSRRKGSPPGSDIAALMPAHEDRIEHGRKIGQFLVALQLQMRSKTPKTQIYRQPQHS